MSSMLTVSVCVALDAGARIAVAGRGGGVVDCTTVYENCKLKL